MNFRRTTSLISTAIPRAIHRRGFGVQSPWAYELVRDVLFEPLHYYAYAEQGLTTKRDRQLYRIRNHYRNHPLTIIEERGEAAEERYESMACNATNDSVLVVEHINNENADLWERIVLDPRAIITFDMRHRGLVVFDQKRIKQNYLL